ncbi:MAG: hypothetical protein CML04_03810 [Pseudozobellia sp.]|nr:hypothetical protein [Pseudozobellia sp.]MBG49270.1 hypothetical protein [Pseudozobellia sp.]|tara:strand:+ start:1361287 stop:1363197 length:1911 start_codon:yes stop_codon:yes gene_type:complete
MYSYLKGLVLIGLFVIQVTTNAQENLSVFVHDSIENQKPWSDKPFYNNPENFQFAIVSDRTGGHRKGIFGNGLNKINKLYPEFVMSVGDLIEGYTKDPDLLGKQWLEFDGIIDSLKTKFFYVAGNHDYSNDVMAQRWKERYGKDYYHFIYKDVLFLVVNSNDGDGVLMGRDQIEYLKEAISQNTDVRWTMVFMHHPMWIYGEANGFNEVEEVLKNRDYTVFAGHTHRYLHEIRNNRHHYLLGTTGGGSKLRGPKFGEFDHVSWVTMTAEGPKMVNLALSGIIDHDVSNGQTREMAVNLMQAAELSPLLLSKENERKVIMVLKNEAEETLYFKGQLFHHHQVQPDESVFEVELPSGASKQITFKVKSAAEIDQNGWDPLQMQWQMGYDSAFMEPAFTLSGTEIIDLDDPQVNISLTEEDIFLKELSVTADHPYENLQLKYTINGQTPDLNSSNFTKSFVLKETSETQFLFADNEGFKSSAVKKEYRKVKPSKASRVGRPKKGLSYSYFEGDFTSIPDFGSLEVIKTGASEDLSPDTIGERLDHYAIQYEGYVKVPSDGVYTFYLRSDDGSKLYINKELVVDNSGSHSAETKKGLVALKKGFHPIQIDYFEDFLGEELQLEYSGPTIERSPASLWYRP